MSTATMTAGVKNARVENIETAGSREDAMHGSMNITVKDVATIASAEIEQPGQFDKRVQHDAHGICDTNATWPEAPASPVRYRAHHRHRSGG